MYSAEISRNQPALIMILIDQSTSMGSPWGDTRTSKAEQLALAVNRVLGNAVLLCSKGDDRIHDYFDVCVLGYGQGVQPILHGAGSARPVLSISDLAFKPKRVEKVVRKVSDGAGGLVDVTTPMPVWVDPLANGWTPMVAAVEAAEGIVSEWCSQHRDSFPPVVINITDGESTDGDPRAAAASLRTARTSDGAALLFTVHLASGARTQTSFPSTVAGLPDRHASVLFEMSSPLPEPMVVSATAMGHDLDPGARGFLYNADPVGMIEFLDIGTRSVAPTNVLELTSGQEDMR